MADRFDGIRLKIKRAWEQLDALKRDVKAFTHSDVYSPRIEFNSQRRKITIKLQVSSPVDLMWSVRIGEIVHNFRSALDNTVYQLVVSKVPARLVTRKNGFPIFQNYGEFVSRSPSYLTNVQPDAIAIIHSEQPFPESNGGTGEGVKSPLWHLAELSNIDKHRVIHFTGSLAHEFNFTFGKLLRDVRGFQKYVAAPGIIEHEAVLAECTSPDFAEWPFEHREAQCDLAIDIAFENGTPAPGYWIVGYTLEDIANRAERIIARILREIFKSEL